MVATRPPSNSAIFSARTDSGVIMIDLGWSGRPQALVGALSQIEARPREVRRVFLTHSHRDHIALWPWLQDCRFHMSSAEVPYFEGTLEHIDTGSRWANGLRSIDLPEPGRLKVEAFGRDTTFMLGSDTLWAFDLPGHTPGSAAYVFRGTAFLGDAVSDDIRGNLGEPMGIFSADMEQARASIRRFLCEIDHLGLEVEWVCSAHATCNPIDQLRAEFER